MWIKYVIKSNEFTLAMKYNVETEKVILGGWSTFYDTLRIFVNDYFKADKYIKTFPSHNRIRIKFDCNDKQFSDVVDQLRDEGVLVQQVQTHGRLMR